MQRLPKRPDRPNKLQESKPKSIEFSCRNCLKVFEFEYTDLCFDNERELYFTPEATCPKCGSTEDIEFTDYGQEKIDDLIFSNQIKTCK